MFGSSMIEAAIGLFLVYFVLSLACAVFYELLAIFLRFRARFMERGLMAIFDNREFTYNFFNNPLIKSLAAAGRPAYISPRTFSLAVLGTLSSAVSRTPYGTPLGSSAPADILRAVDSIPPDVFPPGLTSILRTMTGGARHSTEAVRASIEDWFEDVMGELTSAYKRRAMVTILFISAFFVATFNADTLNIAYTLSRSPFAEKRFQITQETAQYKAIDDPAPNIQQNEFTQSRILNRIGLPLGWSSSTIAESARGLPIDMGDWIQKIVGLLITVLIVTLGASVWFDILNRIAMVRAEKKPAERIRVTSVETYKDMPDEDEGDMP